LALKRLARHDVAPVAGRVANGQEDRLVLGARFSQRLLVPLAPIDGIMRVLQQVRAFGVSESVHSSGLERFACLKAGGSTTQESSRPQRVASAYPEETGAHHPGWRISGPVH
jgi:hypothetical protein